MGDQHGHEKSLWLGQATCDRRQLRLAGKDGKLDTMRIEFVSPTRRRDIENELNDEASVPYADAKPDLSRPALPKPTPFRWPGSQAGGTEWMK